MNRSDLAADLANAVPGLHQREADQVVKLLQDTIARAIVRGQRVEIRGFGSFSIAWRGQRMGRNPRNGEQVIVPPKRAAHFKAGKALREAVDIPVPKKKSRAKATTSTAAPATAEAALSKTPRKTAANKATEVSPAAPKAKAARKKAA